MKYAVQTWAKGEKSGDSVSTKRKTPFLRVHSPSFLGVAVTVTLDGSNTSFIIAAGATAGASTSLASSEGSHSSCRSSNLLP